MIANSATFAIPEHTFVQNVGGEAVLLNLESEVYFGINDVGAEFVDQAGAGVTFGSFVASIASSFGVEQARVATDLDALAIAMIDRGLLVATTE